MDYSECCEGYDPSYGYCPNTDCYYKQLKRKEQECEELKKIIDEAKNSKLDLKSFLVGEAIQNEYEQQLDQLKQTLTEIEKLAIQGNVYCIDYNVDDCEKCIKQSDCKTKLFKQILEKISECEVE
jgi:hypothetical protein